MNELLRFNSQTGSSQMLQVLKTWILYNNTSVNLSPSDQWVKVQTKIQSS